MQFMRRLGAAAMVVAGCVLLVPGSAGASAGSARGPQVGCKPTPPWFVRSATHTAAWGTGPYRWYYNYNANNGISETLTTGTTSTVQYSVQATATVETGVIFASASVAFTAGVSYSHADNLTVSYTLPDIPPHRYGIVQVGNVYGTVVGTYDYQNMECKIVSVQNVIGNFPMNVSPGAIGGYNTSARPPWKQAP